MRIIAGALKGRRLVTPKGDTTRPTADQVRIALMDTLTPRLDGARVLDLFAGAGGVGLEALSRGAGDVTFVERDARAVAALRENVAALGAGKAATVRRGDVLRELQALYQAGERFDIVFLDPPFSQNAHGAVLERLAPRLGAGARIYIEAPSPLAPGGPWRELKRSRAGQVSYQLFQWSCDDQGGLSGNV